MTTGIHETTPAVITFDISIFSALTKLAIYIVKTCAFVRVRTKGIKNSDHEDIKE
jgi:hypothetical protein